MRAPEYFGDVILTTDKCVSNTPSTMFYQERDWTCAFACLRTLISGTGKRVPTENEWVRQCKLKPGPYYSNHIKALNILKGFDVIYGCDNMAEDLNTLIEKMDEGYYVMVESLYSGGHWMVLCSYFPGETVDDHMMLVYDPYFNKVRLLPVVEFIGMWCDVKGVIHDYIALR